MTMMNINLEKLLAVIDMPASDQIKIRELDTGVQDKINEKA